MKQLTDTMSSICGMYTDPLYDPKYGLISWKELVYYYCDETIAIKRIYGKVCALKLFLPSLFGLRHCQGCFSALGFSFFGSVSDGILPVPSVTIAEKLSY